MKTTHVLAPPFGLHPADEARLVTLLQDEDWGSAVTLLRDAMTEAAPARWLVLLAYARFRDVTDVMLDEQLMGCREALQALDRAHELGVPLDDVLPLREEIEETLSAATTAELKLLAQVDGPLDAVPNDVLADAAFALWNHEPSRAAELFLALSTRLKEKQPNLAAVARLRAGLCLRDAKRPDDAAALLAEVEQLPWLERGLKNDRQVAEAVFTARLLDASAADFEALWQAARATGEATGLPFPSVWPNQEKLLERCIALGAWLHAKTVADAIEAGRDVLPRALVERLKVARRGQAS